MAKISAKAAKIAAADYVKSRRTRKVAVRDLEPGMVILRPDGARYRVDSVGDDRDGMLATCVKTWAARGLVSEGGHVSYRTRIDTWGLADAEYERESVPHICAPIYTDGTYDVEV